MRALSLLILAACTATTQESAKVKTAGQDTLEATLEIDAKPSGKRFQGVWLRDRSDHRWVIDYRANPWWRPFEGLRVRAEGEAYTPKGQAISADHWRVRALRLIEPRSEKGLVAIEEETELNGRWTTYTWPKGTKLAGETMTVFMSESGQRYWLYHQPEQPPKAEVPVRIRARKVEPSPFIARPGGPYLWVLNVRLPEER